MTKTQIWNEVQKIAADHKINKKAMAALAELLEPKRGGGHSNRIIIEKDGITYKSCRYTNRLWPVDELIYQNDEMKTQGKDKGYSKVGISLWNKGQKYLKDLKESLMNEIISDDPDQKKVKEMKEQIKEIEEKKLTSDPNWLIQFATEEQLKEIEEKSLPME